MKSLITQLVLSYIRVLAKISLAINKPTVIGITGSFGKTSARDAIYAALKDNTKVHVIRKGNSETGVPLGILGMKVNSIGFDSIHRSIKDWTMLLFQAPFKIFYLHSFQYLIVEMGIDSPLPPKNMEYLLRIVQPQIAVVLNAFPVHAEQFESAVEKPVTTKKITHAIAQEKVKLVTHNPSCEVVIYNKDNESITQFLDQVSIDSMIYGGSEGNHITYVDHEVTLEKTVFTFKIGKRNAVKVNIDGYVLPEEFREIIAAAILVGQYLNIDIDKLIASLEKHFALEAGRNTALKGIHDSFIIDSSYNASPEPVKTMLNLAYALKLLTGRPLIFVFGDMRELGASAKQAHEDIADMLPKMVDYLYTVGPLTKKFVYKNLKDSKNIKEVQSYMSPYDVGKKLKKDMPDEAIILLKGSQNTIFLEEVIPFILKNPKDIHKLARQEKYWKRKKHFVLTE